MKRLSISEAEFLTIRDIAMRAGRMSAERMEDVRAVLLSGLTLEQAAERRAISKQAVQRSVARFDDFRELYRSAQAIERASRKPARAKARQKKPAT
jgi:transposase